MKRLYKLIKNLLYFNKSKILKEVFRKVKPLKLLNQTSYRYSKSHTIESYQAYEFYKQTYNLKDIATLKCDTSKTLFLLGSGPSINEITNENWNVIKENESWAFNLWFIHDFIPNAYFAQVSGSAIHTKVMGRMLRKRQKEYKGIPFILRGTVFNKQKFHEDAFGRFILEEFENVIPLPEFVIHSTCSIEPSKYLDILDSNGFFDRQNSMYPVPKFGATIGLLLSLAIKLGYKKIVLCGVDMLNNDHFYHDKKYSTNDKDIEEIMKFDSSTVNPNANRNKRVYTDFDYILTFKKFLNKHNGDIYLSGPNSILYPHLEIYPDFTK